jgi:hypothetical protein
MATMGKGVVVTGSANRLGWAKANLGELERDQLFSADVLARVASFVATDGQRLVGPSLLHVCFPDSLRDVALPEEIAFRIVETDDVPELSTHTGFPNALGARVDPARPNVLAVTAMRDATIIGVAAASADSNDLWQIGVDVLFPYRGHDIGKALVHRLTSAICARGKIPYYGTSDSNLASRNVAHSVGFVPCWIEVYSAERSRPSSPLVAPGPLDAR